MHKSFSIKLALTRLLSKVAFSKIIGFHEAENFDCPFVWDLFENKLTGLFLCACGLLVLYFATVVFELVVMSVLLGAGLGALSLGTLTLASKAAGEEERRGKVTGIYYTIFYACLGGIPLICGLLADIFDTRLLFLAYAFLLFIVMVIVWRLGKKQLAPYPKGNL
jgi:MFS family permease